MSPAPGTRRLRWSALSKKVKIELNSAGVRELLHSPEITAQLSSIGAAVQGRCGSGYEAEMVNTPTRSVCRVSAVTSAARRDNSDNNTLLSALKGGA